MDGNFGRAPARAGLRRRMGESSEERRRRNDEGPHARNVPYLCEAGRHRQDFRKITAEPIATIYYRPYWATVNAARSAVGR
jgi:hypothetical protein